MFQLRHPHRWLPVLFFSVLLLIGIVLHRDYGLPWDDPIQYRLGQATWDYVTGKSDVLLVTDNCYHNPFIEMLEVLPEKILHPNGERAVYLSKHLFNFIFCWVGLIFFYLLALQLFKDYRFALLACLLFLFTPRLFAHCFFNSKDLPFLFLFVACVYFLLLWLNNPSWVTIIAMILCSGMLTGARVLGILFPILAIIVFAVNAIHQKKKRKEVIMIVIYFLLYPLSVYVFFPTVWRHPLEGFTNAVTIMTHFPNDVWTFFMGTTASSLNIPWYYIPVWMGITIPIGWWFFFIAGMIALLVTMITKRSVFVPIHWFIIIVWLLLPLIAVIMLHSSLYDDGRHLFFIYPPFLLIAVYGIRSLLQKSFSGRRFFPLLAPGGAVVVFLITAIYVMVFMIRFHPYQYVYFNAAGRKYAADYFEKDYWGLSYRSALEWLVKYDHSDHINVCWRVDPGEWNLVWLNNYDRQRIKNIHYDQCDYYITNYRTHRPADASDQKIYEVKVQDFTIIAVYKMHPPNIAPPLLP